LFTVLHKTWFYPVTVTPCKLRDVGDPV